MTNWITCPGCGLKHSPRPDGLCPRCRSRTGESTSPGLPPQPAFATQPFPAAPPPLSPPSLDAPLPTTAWGGGGAPAAMAPRAEITVGSLVSRTFSSWKANWIRFAFLLVVGYLPIALTAMVAGIAAAVTARSTGGSPGPDAWKSFIPLLIVGGIATAFVLSAVVGGMNLAVLQHLAGKRVSMGEMLGTGFRRAWPILLVGIAGSVLTGLGLVALIVPGIIVALALQVDFAVVMAEPNTTVTGALKRSFELTKGYRGTIFGALWVLGMAIWAAGMVGNLMPLFAGSNKGLALALGAASVIGQVVLTPLTFVLSAVAYHDLRVAKEGVDTSQLARVFE